MNLDDVREPQVHPAIRDELKAIKRAGFKRYISPWTRIDAAATYAFPHGLLDFPYVTDVLEATDSQGSSAAPASSVTITKTVTLVSVLNGGTARFFRVRAF